MEKPDLAEKIRVASALADHDSAQGWLSHLSHVVVDSRPEPAPFRQVARGWQWARARKVARALDHYAGIRPCRAQELGPRFFAEVMARGHDKTSGLGREVGWLLGYARRPLVITVAAADWDQAALLLDALARSVELNPWLGRRVQLTKKGATGAHGSVLQVLTADAPTAAGQRPDVVICDELTHWKKRDLWDMLWTGVPKREAMLRIITNAGVIGSWQWEVIQAAKSEPLWDVYEAPGRLDTWMSEAEIRANERLCTPGEAKRLWRNQWIDPAEESGYLTREEWLICEELGLDMGLSYCSRGKRGVDYWAGIDYGPKKDRTALSVVHQEKDGLCVVDSLDVWQGSPQARVQLAQVREWMEEKRAAFPDLSFVADPYQMEEIVQDYEKKCRIERYEARGGKMNYKLAELLRSLVVNRRLAVYKGAGPVVLPSGRVETLEDEMASLLIKKMVYGYRIDHEATKHDDRAVAIGMPLVMLLGGLLPAPFKTPPKVEPEASPEARKSLLHPGIFQRASAEARGLYGMKREDGWARFNS